MILGLAMAILSQIGGAVSNALHKDWRHKGFTAREIWTTSLFALPILIGLSIFGLTQEKTNLSFSYWIPILLWLPACVTHNMLRTNLLAYFTLKTLFLIEFIFLSSIFLLIDWYWFFLPTTPLAVFGLLVVGVGLFFQRTTAQNTASFTLKTIIMVTLLIGLTAFSMTAHKAAASVQTIVFHAGMANILFVLSSGLVGLSTLKIKLRTKALGKFRLFLFLCAFILVCIAETIAFQELPLTTIKVIAVSIPLVVYTLADTLNRRKPEGTLASRIFVFSGLSLHIFAI